MCGIFGFVTSSGHGPDLDRLRRLAEVTERRGQHAFGLAWLGADNVLRTHKRPGAATAGLAALDCCRHARIVIGHCRWATHGTPQDNRNNHPHPAGRGWLVHNGVVFNHQQLAQRYRLTLRTACDSEVLGLLMARLPGSLLQRAMRTARAADGPLAWLGVWRNPARLVVVRNGKPLCFGETPHGFYFGSLPDGLPGQVLPVTDRYGGVLCFASGRLQLQAESLGDE